MRRTPLTPMLLAGLLAAVPAFAQDAAGETGTGRPLPEKCRAEPQAPAAPPSGAPSGEVRTDAPEAAPDSLTATLEPCDGVLAPPGVGDDIAAPPPPEGRTPVIRPDEIPDQPGDARQ